MKKVKKNIEILVIGGGASGMMAAGRAAQSGARVILLEKNSAMGEKLKITGGGRCNIANGELDLKVLLANFGTAEKFLYTPFSIFGVRDTYWFFSSRNLPLIMEDRQRVFPQSQRAIDVFRVLEKYVRENHVEIHLNSPVKKINFEDGKILSVETKTHIFFPKKVILSTGGYSHPETGSTGDGFLWLRQAGHTVLDATPDIVPLGLKEKWIKKISGVALDDIKITFFCNGVKKFAQKGRILCTHFGITGPLVLNSASKVKDLLHEGQVTAKIDILPSLDLGALDEKFIHLFEKNKNKTLRNVLREILPPGFMPAFSNLFPILDLETKIHSVSKIDRKKIGHKMKSLEITVSQLMGLDKAVVSDGGVILEEIDLKTMRSKKCENLFITGDLLNIRRPTGGYSLQLCWTTGYIAGKSAAV